ncbi:MAG TPA: DUF6236 family protein [Streptosporangiaceae bacterium]|nr:DUF6236 family protein [Streptosporangiaceae bacterium]
MPDIALYYPYTHIRDEAWLKAAALYLPKLALIAPPGYPLKLSRVAQVLRDEVGFLVNVDPERRTRAVAMEFLELIRRDAETFTARFAWPSEFPAELYEIVGDHGDRCWTTPSYHRCDPQVEWVHIGKVNPELTSTLISMRLGVPNHNETWLALHPQLGSVYLSALADRIAQANDIPVITDQPHAYGALNGWDIDTLARILLSKDDDKPAASRPAEGIPALYAALAIEAVVPDGLADIPVEKIIQARRTLAAEFNAFTTHLDTLAEQFTILAHVEDPAILRARLQVLLDRDLRQPMAQLERGLRQVNLEPGRAVLGMKTLELPSVAAAAASGVGLPVAAGQAGLVAAQFIASTLQGRQIAAERRKSAAGYLLGLQRELTPKNAVNRILKIFRRASSNT